MAFVSLPITSWPQAKATAHLGQTAFLTSLSARKWAAAATPRRRAGIPIRCGDSDPSFENNKTDEPFRIGVVSTRWNPEMVGAMVSDVKTTLRENGLDEENIVEMQVPGAYELPIAARLMCAAQKVDAVVCIGVLIKGETDHYEYIANAVSSGLMDLQLTLSIPIMFGVLCCRNEEQARARSTGDDRHAKEWALTAIEMAKLRISQIGGAAGAKKSVGFF